MSTKENVSYDTKPTSTEYAAFQVAYDSYNAALFAGQLPQCLITLQRKRGAAGYFWLSQFKARSGDQQTDEIALNPETFNETTEYILSTLVHEMAHLWQAHFGKPSRSGYHNREWAAKMIAISLIPSDTGQPGGKQTGQNMSDYPDPAGAFAAHTARLIAAGFVISWQATPAARRPAKPPADTPGVGGWELGIEEQHSGPQPLSPNSQLPEPNPKNKIKYSCSTCGQNAWAKPNARLICGDCEQSMIARYA